LKKGPVFTGPLIRLLLLLALGMCRVGLLVRSLRMLLGTDRVFLALGVVALAVMFGGGTMGLGGVFVVFGSLVVLVFGHEILVGCQPAQTCRTRKRSRSAMLKSRKERCKWTALFDQGGIQLRKSE